MQDARRRIRLSVAALALFVACQVVLHLINSGDWPRYMSAYALMDGAWIWGMGLLALSAGLVGLGTALPIDRPFNRDARLACRLLVAAGLGVLLLFIFQTDGTAIPVTWAGRIHNLATAVVLLLQGCAMFILVDAGRRSPAWAAVAGRTFFWPALAMAMGYAWGYCDLNNIWQVASIFQRMLTAIMAGWLIVVGVRASTGQGHDAAAVAVASSHRDD